MQTKIEIYLSHDHYTRLVDALVNAPACPFAGKVTPDQIMLALGEGVIFGRKEARATLTRAIVPYMFSCPDSCACGWGARCAGTPLVEGCLPTGEA